MFTPSDPAIMTVRRVKYVCAKQVAEFKTSLAMNSVPRSLCQWARTISKSPLRHATGVKTSKHKIPKLKIMSEIECKLESEYLPNTVMPFCLRCSTKTLLILYVILFIHTRPIPIQSLSRLCQQAIKAPMHTKFVQVKSLKSN